MGEEKILECGGWTPLWFSGAHGAGGTAGRFGRESGVEPPQPKDLRIVWQVATVHVPEVCAILEKFFASHSPSPGSSPA